MIRRAEVQFFLILHGLWEWERNGHRVPSGSPKGGAPATSTRHRAAAAAGPALRHRKTPRDRRRFGRRGVECSETDCRRQPEGWSASDINGSSRCRLRPTRPSTSKNAEGSEASWTEGRRVQRDRLPEATRRASEAKSARSPQGSRLGGAGESNDGAH